MAAPLLEVRDELYTRILTKRDLAEYEFATFTLAKAYVPYEELKNHRANHANGIVYVIPLAGDDMNLSRTNMAFREVPVQVGYQRACDDLDDIDDLDRNVEFVNQLVETSRLDFDLDGYDYSRTEFAKDEVEGLPFRFVTLREAGLFEAYFTTFYKHTLQPTASF